MTNVSVVKCCINKTFYLFCVLYTNSQISKIPVICGSSTLSCCNGRYTQLLRVVYFLPVALGDEQTHFCVVSSVRFLPVVLGDEQTQSCAPFITIYLATGTLTSHQMVICRKNIISVSMETKYVSTRSSCCCKSIDVQSFPQKI